MNTVHKTIKVAGITVTIRELTVAEIRAALKMEETEGYGSDDTDAVDMFLLEDISLPDIRHMTDLTVEQMTGMKPSEIRIAADVCREVNADFFSLRARVLKYIDLLALESPEKSLPAIPEND
jgi:hypothetical protein